MSNFIDEQLDVTNGRINQIEKDMHTMHENVLTLADQIKETQLFLLKLAKNQAEITKRLNQWPFIAVPEHREDEE